MEQINLAKDDISPTSSTSFQTLPIFKIFLVLLAVVGVTSGVIFAKSRLANSSTNSGSEASTANLPQDPNALKVGTTYGSKDESNFPDQAEGVLVAGGVSGEGSHHLVRPGGVSQNVYLSSSVVDLDTVIGTKVQVWGQTMGAKKAGWLIDVGRLKVLELNAPQPE
ncbi:MAG: hypothetical protein WCL07_04335 [bacterium]